MKNKTKSHLKPKDVIGYGKLFKFADQLTT